MALAKVSALRSKDPNTKVGAVIVNKRNRVIGLGYNGMPLGNDKDFPWGREAENESDTKYPYVVHSEMNAILNSTQSVNGSSLYVSLFPCSNCAKFIVQSGIKKIVFEEDKYNGTDDWKISKEIFRVSGVELIQIDKIEIKIA